MKKVSILIPHFKTFRWTAICVNAFKTYGIPVESEIIVCDNSPGHPSIKAITETPLGEGVKVISGNPKFTSHGMGYDLAYDASDGDWIFTSETDSFPDKCGWFDEYVKASAHYDLIGPPIPQSSGRYIHPAGALYNRAVIEKAKEWQKAHEDWVFCPAMAMAMGLSTRAYHVVCQEDRVPNTLATGRLPEEVELWRLCGPFQEMRSFDEDTFETYPQRTGITNFEPPHGRNTFLKIGYEAGQWLHYFAMHSGFKCLEAPTKIQWMDGFEGGQAAFSTVFGGFIHCWCGTVSTLGVNLDPKVLDFKLNQRLKYFSELPLELKRQIETLEAAHQE